MKASFQLRWANKLLGNEYKQGKGVLKDKHGRHCCLGVACDLIDPNGWADNGRSNQLFRDPVDEMPYIKGYDWKDIRTDQVRALVPLLGLSLDDIYALASANDSGKPFTEIAKMIMEIPPNDTGVE